MSLSLHPTKTRLALLQAVADGAVTQHYPILPDPIYSQVDRVGAGWRAPGDTFARRWDRVTSRIDELNRAGWVRLGAREGDHYKSPRLWDVTPLGREVLDGAR